MFMSIAEDVPLRSFSKVVETIEEEIRAGHICKVYDLELGYMKCAKRSMFQ